MRKSTISGSSLLHFVYSFPVVVFVLMGLIVLHPEIGRAQFIGCEVDITKEATPSDGTVFTFDVTGALDSTGFDLASGDGKGFAILGGHAATVVEEVPQGWRLVSAGCDSEGVIVTRIENGIELQCSPNGGNATCTFENESLGQIPTLSEWGMIAAAAGLMIVGVIFAVRRRRLQAGV